MLLDARDRVIAGGLLHEDAEEIVNALNSQRAPLRYECAITEDREKRWNQAQTT